MIVVMKPGEPAADRSRHRAIDTRACAATSSSAPSAPSSPPWARSATAPSRPWKQEKGWKKWSRSWRPTRWPAPRSRRSRPSSRSLGLKVGGGHRRHRRALLGREPGADPGDRPHRQGGRGDRPARRRLQAAHQPVQLPGAEGERAGAAGRGPRRDRPGRRHRGDGPGARPAGGQLRRRAAGRRPQHAELPAAGGGRRSGPAGAAQARPVGDDGRIPAGRRVHPQDRQHRRSCCASAASAPSRTTRASRCRWPRCRTCTRRRTCRWSSIRATAPARPAWWRRWPGPRWPAGADGLIVEVHPDPEKALSDGFQALTPAAFRQMMAECRKVAAAIGRELS